MASERFVHARETIALRRVQGIGPTWARALIVLGVTTPAQLIASDLNALARQLPGVSVERLVNWRRAALALPEEKRG